MNQPFDEKWNSESNPMIKSTYELDIVVFLGVLNHLSKKASGAKRTLLARVLVHQIAHDQG